MKIKNLYLLVALLCCVLVFVSSLDISPDAKLINLFGYDFGLNFTHNPILKIVGIAALCLFLFDKKSDKVKVN